MKVSLVYNLKRDPALDGVPIDYYSEFDSMETIEAITGAIGSIGHKISLVEADNRIIENLLRQEPDIVFNIAEGLAGPSRESRVPAILDYLAIPYTGSGVLALALSLNKAAAKKLFTYQKVPTPRSQLFKYMDEPLKRELTFPLIVKPNSEGSAKGLTKDSVVYNKARLYEEIGKVIDRYGQEALVEEFIDGKELTVGVIGNGNFIDLPVLEIDFSNCRDAGEYFYSWRMKEYQGDEELGLTPQFSCPAAISEELSRRVKEIACKAHRIINCADFSRVDIRLSRDNVPYVLEINPLPGLDPKESHLPIIARAAGMNYKSLIGAILEEAVSRNNITNKAVKPEPCFSNTTITYACHVAETSKDRVEGGRDVI